LIVLGNEPRHAIGLRPRIPNRYWRSADVTLIRPLDLNLPM
jgi:hypothetical protein